MDTGMDDTAVLGLIIGMVITLFLFWWCSVQDKKDMEELRKREFESIEKQLTEKEKVEEIEEEDVL